MNDVSQTLSNEQRPNDAPRSIDGGTLAGGLILIAVGLLFLLDQLHFADFGYLLRSYWPMFIVAVGIPKLFRPEMVWGGLWLIALGAWMQISHLGLFGFSWSNSWPLLMIVIGLGMTLRAILGVSPRTSKGERDGS